MTARRRSPVRGSTRRQFLKAGAAAGAMALIPGEQALTSASHVFASVASPQTPLESSTIPKYVQPLRTFHGQRVGAANYAARMVEFQQQVLPPGFSGPTWLWGYQIDDRPASWPGFSVEARRGTPTTVAYINSLPVAARGSHVEPHLTVDQTLHWADPTNGGTSTKPYVGPVPGVVHLHGAEVPSQYDGAPEAWMTANGIKGRGYSSLAPVPPNMAVYRYPNTQPGTTLWFHDHTLGITRLNVFAGLAAFYLLRDQFDTGEEDNPLRLPSGAQEIELMIQDRLFDTNGQLRFPDGSNTTFTYADGSNADLNGGPGNPFAHPFAIPEFFGDAMTVNGRTWPFLNVEPRRYRFRFLNACNAKFLRMNLATAAAVAAWTDPTSLPPSAVPIWQIGTDGGLLDRPVKLNDPAAGAAAPAIFIAPSERADVIVDFSGLAGQTLILASNANFPFPSGGLPNPAVDGQILKINVNQPLSSRDETFNPASGGSLRGGRGQPPPIVRLANPATGRIPPGVNVSVKRQLLLFEQDTFADAVTANGGSGPLEDLLNNTRWKGQHDGTNVPIPGSKPDTMGQGIWMTELPRLGATELWELLDVTPDSHPIHIHLIQFQVLNRQSVDVASYMAAWSAAFPGGTFAGQLADGTLGMVTYAKGTVIPGYGPPGDYNTPNADGAVGGNPAFTPFLNGPVVPPEPQEAGWKDTFKAYPNFMNLALNRVLARWAPIETPLDDVHPGQNLFAFDPTTGPGYIWHCHILDHEDAEMMRPYAPVK